jgi:ABC-type uncharacterized transport system auxiliary subunit
MEKLMKKSFLFLVLLLAVGLAGCLPKEQATPTSTSISTATATTEAQPTATVVLTVPTETALLPNSDCTVISRQPTPDPSVESIYPPVTEADHVKGPDDAKVTIIEYSDFQ